MIVITHENSNTSHPFNRMNTSVNSFEREKDKKLSSPKSKTQEDPTTSKAPANEVSDSLVTS